jgi:Domain of unknown function (DUF4326)
MSVNDLKGGAPTIRRPVRMKRSTGKHPHAVDVGPGTKWNNPIKKRDVDALVSSEPDIAAAVQKGGWKAAAVILYRDHLLEAGLDPSMLHAKDLSCTCELTEPCHADVLLELANA